MWPWWENADEPRNGWPMKVEPGETHVDMRKDVYDKDALRWDNVL